MPPRMIRIEGLTKVFRGLRAVDRVDLEVEAGTLFGFLGPNGAGKTTTLKMMAGVLMPTEGRILINGLDLAKDPCRIKRWIGYIPDRPYIYEKLTGREFLLFLCGIYGIPASETLEEEILALLGTFGLARWKDAFVESYSHGMKQRLVMCAALIHNPLLMIVDEPMVGLDPKGARLVKEIFLKKAREGTTIFMSTHSLQVAEELCDRIAIIHGGRIIAEGTPEDLRVQAGTNGTLEEVFLVLTEEAVSEDA